MLRLKVCATKAWPRHCLTSLSNVVMKHHAEGSLRGRVKSGLWFQRVTVHDGRAKVPAGTAESSQFELKAGGREGTLGMTGVF